MHEFHYIFIFCKYQCFGCHHNPALWMWNRILRRRRDVWSRRKQTLTWAPLLLCYCCFLNPHKLVYDLAVTVVYCKLIIFFCSFFATCRWLLLVPLKPKYFLDFSHFWKINGLLPKQQQQQKGNKEIKKKGNKTSMCEHGVSNIWVWRLKVWWYVWWCIGVPVFGNWWSLGLTVVPWWQIACPRCCQGWWWPQSSGWGLRWWWSRQPSRHL